MRRQLSSKSNTYTGNILATTKVRISRNSCVLPNPIALLTTDSEGNYSYGGLDAGTYMLAVDDGNPNFPAWYSVQIPQAIIQSYDFTASPTE